MKLRLEKCPICQVTTNSNDDLCRHCYSPHIFAIRFLDVYDREQYKNELAMHRSDWEDLKHTLEMQLRWHKEGDWHKNVYWSVIWHRIKPKAVALGFDEPAAILLAQSLSQESEFSNNNLPEKLETSTGYVNYDHLKTPAQREIAAWVNALPSAEYSVIDWVNFLKSISEISNYDQMNEILVKEISRQFFTFETVSVNYLGNLFNQRQLTTKVFIEALDSDIEIRLVKIPHGTFEMGSCDLPHTSPVHLVEIPEFYLGAQPVTQKQWEIVARFPQINLDLAANPSFFRIKDKANLPVDSISWQEALEFCRRLAQQTGRKYRLPSEAEWEYAARAGSSKDFAFGDTITPYLVNYDGEFPYKEAPPGNRLGTTSPVGSFEVANEFGLFDIHGNVWEWCADIWHEDYTSGSKPKDGSAWVNEGDADRRVLRGGAWCNWAALCLSSERISENAGDDGKLNYIGFRLALDL